MSLDRRWLAALCALALAAGEACGQGERPAPRRDRFGDPLPPAAVARLGSLRFWLGAWPHLCQLSPDGKTVLVSAPTGPQVWDAQTGAVVREFHAEKGAVTDLAASAEGKRLAGRVERDVCVWDVGTGRTQRLFRDVTDDYRSLALIDGGKTLVTGTRDGRVVWRDVTSGRRIREWDVYEGRWQKLTKDRRSGLSYRPVLSPDGALLAAEVTTWREDGMPGPKQEALVVWDVAARKALWRVPLETTLNPLPVFSPDGRLLALEEEARVVLREAATGKLVRRLPPRGQDVAALAFSGDGKVFASAHDDGPACVWEVATGKRRRRVDAGDNNKDHDPSDVLLSLSGDGRRLAAAAGRSLRVWDTATGDELFARAGHRGPVQGVAFSADGRSLLSESRPIVCRWDTATWRVRTISRSSSSSTP